MSPDYDCEHCANAPYCDGPHFGCYPAYDDEHYREPEYHGEYE